MHMSHLNIAKKGDNDMKVQYISIQIVCGTSLAALSTTGLAATAETKRVAERIVGSFILVLLRVE